MDAVRPASGRFAGACAAWVGWASRLAWPVLLLSVAVTAALLAYTAAHLRINTDSSSALSKDLPFRQHYIAYKEAFPWAAAPLVVVIDGASADAAAEAADTLAAAMAARRDAFAGVLNPAGDPFLQRNGLLYLDEAKLESLADRLAAAQPLLATLARDPSLRGLFEVLGLAVDDLATGSPGGDAAQLAPALAAIGDVLDGRAAAVSWRELMMGADARDGRRRFVLAMPRLDYASLKPAQTAMAAVREAAAALGLTPENGVRVRLTGAAALDTEELQSVQTGASRASFLSLGLVTLLLAVGLRSWRLSVSVLVTLVIGLAWTAGFAAVAIGELNLLSVAFAVLFIGLGVDFGIHYALRYREAVEGGLAQDAALRTAGGAVGGSLVLAAVAASIAFLSFVPTPYRGVAELGIISAAGMAIAVVLSLTLLPALCRLLPYPSPPTPEPPPSAGALSGWILRHRRAIAGAGIAIAAAAALLVPQLRFDYDPLDLKDPTRESVSTLRELVSDPHTPRYTISVVAPDLAAADALATRLKDLSTVGRTITASNLVPQGQEEKRAAIDQVALLLGPALDGESPEPAPDDAARAAALRAFAGKVAVLLDGGYRGPLAPALAGLRAGIERALAGGTDLAALERRLVGSLPRQLETLRQALDPTEVRLDNLPDVLRAQYLAADGRARVEVVPKEPIAGNDTAFRAFVADVQSVAPDATDSPVVVLAAGDAVLNAFVVASLIAIVVITALLFVLLRRAWDVCMVLVPVVLAALTTIGFTVVADLAFNFANVIVLPLLIGLGVASGIHLVARARYGGSAALLATSTPRAVMYSALTTVASFGSLAVSSHRGTASLGELLTVSITLTLIYALIVLPALLFSTRRYDRPAAQ
ncbi:MAG: MMPL family transporter [Rhodospirillales bacterium]